MTEDVEIRAERVASVMAQIPLAVAVTVVNALIMATILRPEGSAAAMPTWLAATAAVALARLGVWWMYRRDRTAALAPDRWGRISALGAGAAGLLWGLGASWMWPAEEAGQLFWVFVVGGMCSGAAALHSAHLPTAFGFILPAALPLGLRFALEGTDRGYGGAAMCLVFVAALAVLCARGAALFGSHVRLGLDLAHKAAELDRVNASLREEMAQHSATEAHLRHAQKMEALGQLTGGIAHDFNNLLTAVLGSLALLKKRMPTADDRAQRLLENARQAAERGAALTQRLLAFGRRQVLDPAPIGLPALIGGMGELLRGSVGAGIRIASRFPADLPPVRADANQLELAVLNLVLNARDAMPAGGEVTLTAEPRIVRESEPAGLAPGPYVVLSVADTGEGMDEATLARAMEPFFTTKEIGKGTGLGLSMVHGMAAQSGGRLLLRSRPGEGTVAELWLPRAAAGAALPARPVEAPQPARMAGGRVLVVDDDPLVLASTVAVLEDLGHRALPAMSGREALDMLRAGVEVTLVLSDYGMPAMNGQQLAGEVQALRPGLPVLIATGYGELPGLAAAGLARLSKPFTAETLGRAIAEQMRGATAAEAAR